jgi:AmmeMemoRadiSam system protein A
VNGDISAFPVDTTPVCANINHKIRVLIMKNEKKQKILFHGRHLFRILLIFMVFNGLCSGAVSNAGETREERMSKQGDLTEAQGEYLLLEARKTIQGRLSDKKSIPQETKEMPTVFNEKRGTFVTLTSRGNLRGCIGHIIPQESLIEGIRENAINAAFRDPRFSPLNTDEWKNVQVEISILTEPKPLAYTDGKDLLKKLRPGIDGVIIKKGFHQSTFLPQVWDQLPDKKAFLNHLCLKAGLAENAWEKGDLEVSTYQVQAFEE